MSYFYRFFRKYVWKYICRSSQHEIEHNDSLVELGPNKSSDPTTSSLDNPSTDPPLDPDPSTTGTIQPTQVVGINEEAIEDIVLSSSFSQESFLDGPLAETAFHPNPPATSTIESSLNSHNIDVVIRAIEELVFNSIQQLFSNPKEPLIRSTEEAVRKDQNQILVDSPNIEETLLISYSNHNHVVTSEQCTAVSEAAEILETEREIPLNPFIETHSIQPFSPCAPRKFRLLHNRSNTNEDSLSKADSFAQSGSSHKKSIPTEFNPNNTKRFAIRNNQVSEVNFAFEKGIHTEIPSHVTAPESTQRPNQFPQRSIPLTNPARSGQSTQNYVNPPKPKNVAESASKSEQVAKSSAHSGSTKDMVSESEQATTSSSLKLTQLPQNSTALRHYLESTSPRRAASPNPVNTNKQAASDRRSVSNTPRTPPRQTVTTERSTVVVKGPIRNAPLQRPSGLCNGKRNFEPARKDVPKESEECTHNKRVEEIPDTPTTPAWEVSLVSLLEVSESTKEVLESAMRKFGMKEMTTEGYWNVRWTDKGIPMEAFQKLLKYQRISRFPGSGLLMTKNNLAKNTSRMKQIFPEEYEFVPETWCLPGEIKRVEQYAKAHEEDCFIVKPNDGSSGRGIIITRNTARLQLCDKMVCQVYISRPFLIDGFKFDLRIYTLITSCRPLRLFVYNEGLARFATEQYHQPNQQNESNRYMHLTNYAVNKRSPFYTVCETKGTLRRLSTINKWLIRRNIDSKKVWESMDEAIVKTIISFLPALRHYYRVSFPDQVDSNSCFQIMGFDIIFDENLKPYVLEVNDSPSFKADVPLDKEMTEALIYDTFNILHLDENNRSKVLMEEKRQSTMRILSSSTQNRKKWHKEKEQSQRSLTQSRIEWEDTHMGNFRKVFPNDSKMKNYKKFIRAAHEIFQHHPW